MSINDFAENNNVSRKTVEKWIKEELIPKADLHNDFVPDSARVPYTRARAKNAKSIYCSMVKASSERKHILPVLYKMCEDEFNSYVERLICAGYLVKRISDGVTYYDATIETVKISSKNFFNTIKVISQGVSEGITSAILNY